MFKRAQISLLLVFCLLVLPSCGFITAGDAYSETSIPLVEEEWENDTSIDNDESIPSPLPPTSLPIVEDDPEQPLTADAGLIARRHLTALADTIGARTLGSPEEAQAAQYIQQVLQQAGYATRLQPFSFSTDDGDDLNSTNVIAVKHGRSSQEILVGAHYDSVDDGSGADDNASGVAVMLEVAERLVGEDTPYTIVFVAFGAEEYNMDGSRYYVEQMSAVEVKNTVNMINMDSLVAGDLAYVYGDDDLSEWIDTTAQSYSLDLEYKAATELDEPDGTPCDCADYDAFQEAGIPFAYFEATNWNLGDEDGMTQVNPRYGDEGTIRHTRYDTIEAIEALFPGRIDHHLALFVDLLYAALTQYE